MRNHWEMWVDWETPNVHHYNGGPWLQVWQIGPLIIRRLTRP